MRERRLGSRHRRERWDYGELISVTLVLIWWSAVFRMIWTTFVITYAGAELDFGWLSPIEGTPPILKSLIWLLLGLVVMTAGCLLEPRNRTRFGLAIAGFNVMFVSLLAVAVYLQTAFSIEYAADRASGARSEWILAGELAGPWEVAKRIEAADAPRFPAESLWLDFNGMPALRLGRRPDALDVWASLEAKAPSRPRTRLFEHLLRILRGPSQGFFLKDGNAVRRPGLPYELPAVIVEAIVRPRINDLPSSGYCTWVAELHDPNPRELEFQLTYVDGRATPDARVWLRRIERPKAGWDLGLELALLRQTTAWD
jgi:hypothetical protein